jgi:hypothetical protein
VLKTLYGEDAGAAVLCALKDVPAAAFRPCSRTCAPRSRSSAARSSLGTASGASRPHARLPHDRLLRGGQARGLAARAIIADATLARGAAVHHLMLALPDAGVLQHALKVIFFVF